MQEALVSVIIPTYNRAGKIKKSIESVLNQTYSNLEVYVIDDCSKDNTEEVVKSIDDNRVIYYRCEKNGGANVARNIGINLSNADYIAFHDSDDIWHKDKLEKQMRVLIDSPEDTSFVYCAVHYIGKNSASDWPSKSMSMYDKTQGIRKVLLGCNIVPTPTILAKKENLLSCGMFDENVPRLQDWELVLRLSKVGSVKYVDEALVDVELSDNSITHNGRAYVVGRCIIIKKNIEDYLSGRLFIKSIFEMVSVAMSNFSRRSDVEWAIQYIYDNFSEELSKRDIGIAELSTLVKNSRGENYYNFCSDWWASLNRCNSLPEKRNVVLYGYGKFGVNFVQFAQKKNIEIVAVIDDYVSRKLDKEFKVYSVSEFKEIYKQVQFDCIVVTPFFEYTKIEELLNIEFENISIVPLDGFVKNNYM